MKVIIISGGKPPSKELIVSEMESDSVILCADSGADCLYSYDITPDYLIGDFDSINKNVLEYYKSKDTIIEKFPIEKDYTDTQLALFKAIDLNASKIIFLGCTGSRLDHTLGNITLLLQCMEKRIDAYIVDDNNRVFITDKCLELSGSCGDKFSLLAYNIPVKDLCITGAKYELSNYYLDIGDPLTLSNEFVKEKVKIIFKSGKLLIMKSRD